MLLKDYVPFFISKINQLSNIYNAQQKEIDKLNLDIKDLVKQCFVNTATWGLSWWEDFVGITTDTSKSIAERRSNVLGKLRGQGTTTKKIIEEIAQAYADKVKVVEHNKESYFTIDLESINKGFPYELNSLYNIIEEIQPCHLEAVYNLNSTTKSKIKIGTITRYAETITVYPYNPKQIELKGTIKLAIGDNTGLENITVYPRKGI